MLNRIIRSFDRAAPHYDEASALQQIVAQRLVRRAQNTKPDSILDIGCGTGAVSLIAAACWPLTSLTGIDASPAMLQTAKAKIPRLQIMEADAADIEPGRKYDLIFSSMLLHWLPRPADVLRNWIRLLNPGGSLHVALPVATSLHEWRDLCHSHHVQDGLWEFPTADFAEEIAADCQLRRETLSYESLRAFLDSLKRTGAHEARAGYAPFSAARLRRMLKTHRGIFAASYDILYLSVTAPSSTP